MDSKKIIAKHKRAVEAWLGNPRNDPTERTLKELRKQLASPLPRAPAVAALQLTHLRPWISRQAIAQILRDDPAGWGLLNKVLHYTACKIEVDPGIVTVNEISLAILHALAFEAFSLASRLGAVLVHGQTDPRVRGWEVSPLPRLALRLCELAQRKPLSAVMHPGPTAASIDRLFDAWTDPTLLTAAIHGLCEWHLQESLESVDYPCFGTPPYELFAVDVLAVLSVLRNVGLGTTPPSHPLLDMPLARPPLPLPPVRDELLDLVRERNERAPVPEAARYRELLANLGG